MKLRVLSPAVALSLATACVVLWQHHHVAVLWDLAYLLDTAARIAGGAMPYRDFPLAHAPIPFLIQAAILRAFGPGVVYAQIYTALAGALGTMLTWLLLRGAWRSPALAAFALAAPLTVLGLFCVFPFPSYDCDSALMVLLALWLWQRMADRPSTLRAILAGAAQVLPLFTKQNIGLPYLAAVVGLTLLLLLQSFAGKAREELSPRHLLQFLAGLAAALLLALFILQMTCGLDNYLHWTLRFAMRRRMVSMSAMLSIFLDSALRWMLPSILAGLLLLRFGPQKRWKQTAGFLLLATPLAWPVLGVFFYDDADSRGDCLLSLWPLLLALTILHLILQLRQGLTAHLASALMVLAAIYGTLLSQQIWGSTYSLWPFFLLLAADLLMALRRWPGSDPRLPLALAAVMALVLLISGGLYTVSEERLSYIDIPDGPVQHATHPALRGLSSPGPYIGEFEELLDYAAHNIPAADGILILPGEDPFYYATGRRPQFPVLLFDPATDPLSPTETAQVARRRSIRWLILKTHLQIRDDVTPSRTQTLAALLPDYRLVRRLRGYEVYQRATTKY